MQPDIGKILGLASGDLVALHDLMLKKIVSRIMEKGGVELLMAAQKRSAERADKDEVEEFLNGLAVLGTEGALIVLTEHLRQKAAQGSN